MRGGEVQAAENAKASVAGRGRERTPPKNGETVLLSKDYKTVRQTFLKSRGGRQRMSDVFGSHDSLGRGTQKKGRGSEERETASRQSRT